MAAASVGALLVLYLQEARAGTAKTPPPLNPVHPSGDVQVILTRLDSPPPRRDTPTWTWKDCVEQRRRGT
uniref:Uncharacterized protein n=1 Tax=Triticum urartu TaxID=4572 RepID=A0A8R7UPB9_TRIUA